MECPGLDSGFAPTPGPGHYRLCDLWQVPFAALASASQFIKRKWLLPKLSKPPLCQ